ncbi:MAG: hypothetical protein WCS59_01685 [Sphaerochaetaceae bacterium]|nr:hypothetical protein [Sphaerochaetaceae bacterium]MDD4219293.1 hypothetical protein [Sphaerochaetaceae bacterium]
MPTRASQVLLIIILSVLVCVLLIGYWLYTPFRQEVLFITHSPTFKGKERFTLQWKFAQQGWTFRVETIPLLQIGKSDLLVESIQKSLRKRTELLVCSPLITFALKEDVLLLPPKESSIRTVGMGKALGFDYVLVKTQQDHGWSEAARAVSKLANKTPLPTVLLYSATDKKAQESAKLFSANFKGGVLDEVALSTTTAGQARATMHTINASGALLIVVPYLANFAQFLAHEAESGVRWIVDDLYAPLIERKHLEGVVFDDVYQSILPLLQEGSDQVSQQLPLIRSYRSYKTAWKNWF